MNASAATPKPSFAVRHRTRIGAVLGLLIIASLLFVDSGNIARSRYVDAVLDFLGTFFVVIGVLGRLWCTLYIGGKKNKSLQSRGPYSFVRHPLYFFSMMLGIGISLISGNLIVLALVAIYFIWQYRITIRFEEKTLRALFGTEYDDYSKRVRCFVPSRLHYDRTPPEDINMEFVKREALHGLFFLMFIPILEAIIHLNLLRMLPHIRF